MTDPSDYRGNAARVRALAAATDFANIRDELLAIAVRYEAMVRQREMLDRASGSYREASLSNDSPVQHAPKSQIGTKAGS